MGFSFFLGKLKSLTPFAIAGVAMTLTIKLLTTQTPSKENSLNVTLEEDIKIVNYEDEIVIPEEERKETEEEEQIEEESQDSSESDMDSGSEEEKEKQEDEKQQKEEQKTKPRMFREGDKMGALLKKLLTPPKK